ncbi:uncharacterized protein Z518_09843 [Rhinocladiella mackenziei CBS 650.93]|uniref:rRNA adenine N(6)-methyltransferase n=1 Tax=Rhinocladiella mackenziei CBS 650.93 TaxID=1442369 RepID=A0A0D2GR28_9EURO|nr:uncharacterized protein Z518_09843 [Rhinocladiella mackenziei CBS 650.93]KIX00778.1 hypothetical protein Z518_09843 [Rhinocladiella mackenziei CBS 650.93]
MVIRCFFRQASTVTKKRIPKTQAEAASSSGRQRNSRHEIVNQQLCDQILDRIKTTLPAPHSCDLIDIYPGEGLWSRALHAILKPRRHVLVEPALSTYSVHLDTLLSPKGTPYRHTNLLEEAFDPTQKMLSKYDTDHDEASGKIPRLNPSLLITANLSGAPLRIANYTGTQSRKFFDDLYLSLWKIRGNIHRYGLVRVLAWVPDGEKDAYIPRTVAARRKQSIMLEASYAISEIAGASNDTKLTRFTRWPDIDVQDHIRVAAEEQTRGLKTPESRREQIPQPDLLSFKPTSKSIRKGAFTSDAEWVFKFMELDDWLKKHDSAWYKRNASGRFRGKHIDSAERNGAERKAWRRLLKVAETRHKTHMKAVGLVKQQRELFAEWKSLVLTAENNTLAPGEEKRLQTLAENLDQQIKKLNRTNKVFAEKAIDDLRAYDMSPPIMWWNKREAEPLIVNDSDFHPPQQSMALLDVVPRPEFLSRIDTHDKMVCFGYVVKTLATHIAGSLADALKSLVHEGYEEFVKTIPSIHDPTKGGWYDLSQLRVRALPAEIFVQIALAYEKWPFRLSIESIIMMSPDPQAAYSLGDDG